MRVLIAGSSGFIGRSLVSALQASGHTVLRLVRPQSPRPAADVAQWDPASGALDPALIASTDAVINLCGRNIGQGRWTARVKQELRDSRIKPTGLLARTIADSSTPPSLFVNFSATGFYGDRGEERLTEESTPGTGFLAGLSKEWEAEAAAARSDRTRVVLLRLGMVIGPGGALKKMLPPFKLGLGGPIGSGRQWWSWIAITDVIGAIECLLEHENIDGPLNLVAPEACRCRDFSKTLGTVLARPAFLPLPAFAARLVAGEMADALLLASAHVRPIALEDTLGYSFRQPDLAGAIRSALGS